MTERMDILSILGKFLGKVFHPVRVNAAFFAFMYVLGVLCAWLTLPQSKGAELYGNLYLELFLDIYLVCLVLSALPERLRKWVRRLLYALFYAVAVADVYCFVKFESTLTPTMLLLVGETNGREAGEFLRSYLSFDVLFSAVGWLFLLIALHIIFACRHRLKRLLPPAVDSVRAEYGRRFEAFARSASPYIGLACAVLLVWSAVSSCHNKLATWKLMTSSTIGSVEHVLTERDHAVLYTPIMRLVFSLYANSLASEQIEKLVAATDKVRVDSCSFTSPNIVLIIGESYGKHHSQQYGYFMPTTPRQIERERTGLLVKYTDVVSPWNLTSFVFKNLLSMHVVGQQGEWCDYPLFTELFRKAGYHVTFITNQFLPQAKEAVYDFSGGFFLNNPKLSAAQFDTRNTELHQYDEALITDYEQMIKDGRVKIDDTGNAYRPVRSNAVPTANTQHRNLIIFHLMGQHVAYKLRSPKDRKHFKGDDYNDLRPELNAKQRRMLAEYDNAVLYNDSIVDRICSLFEHKDAVVIYVPDHGEECFEGTRNFICRNHSAEIDYDLARYEFEIPFWIWCSHGYAVKHPEIYKEIVQAKDRPLMTDALAHTLLYLAGISAPDYREEYNVLSTKYDEKRPRILKGVADYDKLRPAKDK